MRLLFISLGIRIRISSASRHRHLQPAVFYIYDAAMDADIVREPLIGVGERAIIADIMQNIILARLLRSRASRQ